MKKIFGLLVVLMIAVGAKAQDWYAGGMIGLSHSMSENMRAKELIGHEIPGLSVFIGNHFTPKWGMRVNLGLFRPQNGRAGTPQNTIWPQKYGRFRFNTSTADLDVMLNLSNILGDVNPLREFEFYGVVGGGGLYTWWFSDRVKSWEEYYPVDTRHRLYWNAHAGFQCQQRINRHWKMMYEAKCYTLPDYYNGVDTKVALGTYLDFSIGAVYYFDDSKRVEIMPVEVRHEYLPPYEAFPDSMGNAENARLMFYTGSHSLIDSQRRTLTDIAEYAKTNPNKLVVLTTFPDNENLPEEQNARLAKQREDEIVKILKGLGVELSRIVKEPRSVPLYRYTDTGDWIVGATISVR